jgi:hypothetical protein
MKNIEEVMDAITAWFVIAFLLLTFPVWVIPYTVYRVIKERRNNE